MRSRLAEHLPDHLLAEVVQGWAGSREAAEAWWESTFAAHQGHGGDEEWRPSAIDRPTSRLMLDAWLSDDVTQALRETPVPAEPQSAEHLLAAVLSTRFPALEQAPFSDRARRSLYDVLRAYQDDTLEPSDHETQFVAGDLARAVLLLVADRPDLMRARSGHVLAIPIDSMTGILDEAQRYLAHLGAQGPPRTVHPSMALAAIGLARRTR